MIQKWKLKSNSKKGSEAVACRQKGADMAKNKKNPLRKSVVSNEVIDKRDLCASSRIKKVRSSDPTGKANGRGAYIQKLDNEEAPAGQKKQVFNVVSVWSRKDFYDELTALIDHKGQEESWVLNKEKLWNLLGLAQAWPRHFGKNWSSRPSEGRKLIDLSS